MLTVSNATTTLEVLDILGYESERTSGNVVHDVIGTGTPTVTLGEMSLRTGTLQYLCATRADATALENLHTQVGTVTLTEGDIGDVSMTYVCSGRVSVKLDDESRSVWTVSVDFQEVPA
jgi:hypothetical protein